MRAFWWLFGGVVLSVLVAAGTGVIYVRTTGLDSRAESGSVETRLARLARGLAVPADVKSMRNPVSLTPDVLAEGLAHFADHCATCHGDDGAGGTEMGRGLYPKAPDMVRFRPGRPALWLPIAPGWRPPLQSGTCRSAGKS